MKTERRISSGGVVFRERDGAIDVALISVKGGKAWGLPKGLVEKGEDLARTAHREVREETGLDGRIIGKIGRIEYFFAFKDGDEAKRAFKIVYFFLMEYTGGDVADHDQEVEDCGWFPIDEAVRLMKYEDEKGILKKAGRLIKKELRARAAQGA